MKCAWKELISILPPHIRTEVDKRGKDSLQELRMRLGRPIELVMVTGSRWIDHPVSVSDMNFVVNAASRYSPWSSETIGSGYITAPGGHRIGICGECVMNSGVMTGIRSPTSLCIRVARDVTGIAPTQDLNASVLILGPPGSGKTTLLRDLIRKISNTQQGSVTVVDERGEIFPLNCDFCIGERTDVLTLCKKPQGVMLALRTMGPAWIAVDEITAQEDCEALLHAGWCGVKLLATAHADNRQDLMNRPGYAPLTKSGLFETLLILQPDKSWRMERMR